MAKQSGFTVTFDKKTLALIAKAPVLTLNALAEETVFEAKKRSPHKTGTNRRSIDWDSPNPKTTRRIFTTSGYGGFLEIGTGLFGPHKRRIVPKRKKALFWKGAAHPVKSVKGRPATPYFRPSIQDVIRRAPAILKEVIPEGNA